MFLKTQHVGFACISLLLMGKAQADQHTHSAFQYRATGEIGFDAWDIHKTADRLYMERLLFLADSTPQWSERNPSPWVKFDGLTLFSPQLSSRFKFRGSQSSDWRIDELNLNWDVSPTLGATVGVVDYKTSWCRTYDVDSAWARENDPFCTVRTTEQATGAAPGAQIHSNWNTGNVQWQAQVGIYNPLLFNYDDEEFNNQALPNQSYVSQNRKYGVSINAVHLYTGTELRVGFLSSQQTAQYQPGRGLAFYEKPQDTDVVYLGFSVPLTSKTQLRLTHLDSRLKSRYLPNDGDQARWKYDFEYDRTATTAEVYWRLGAADTVALGYSRYGARDNTFITRKSSLQTYQLNASKFMNQSWSIAWRRDWTKALYTSAQWSSSSSADEDASLINYSPQYQVKNYHAKGRAVGLRVGVRF